MEKAYVSSPEYPRSFRHNLSIQSLNYVDTISKTSWEKEVRKALTIQLRVVSNFSQCPCFIGDYRYEQNSQLKTLSYIRTIHSA